MSKILQIIPADGLFAKVVKTEEQDIVIDDPFNERGGGRIIETRNVMVQGKWGEPLYDYYPVVYLALVETDEGQQEVRPMAINIDSELEDNLVDISEWDGYSGLSYYDGYDEDEDSNSITIVRQGGTGFVTFPKDKIIIGVEHEIGPDATALAEISCIVDGKSLTLGYYSDDNSADFAYHKLVDDMSRNDKVYMPDSQEIDAEYAKRKRHEEYLDATRKDSDINTTFTEKTAEVLIKTAKCYTLDDIEVLTKDEMMERISKGVRRRRPKTCEYVINELQEKGYLSDNA